MSEQRIIEVLEQAAQAYPWDQIQLTIHRDPGGRYEFRFWIPSNEKLGDTSCTYAYGNGPTPEEAFEALKRQAGSRDPEEVRKQALAALRVKIAKLEAMTIGLPPYRPALPWGQPAPVEQVEPPKKGPEYINV